MENGGFLGFYGGFMGFYDGWMGFYSCVMGFYGGWMGFYGGLMGLIRDWPLKDNIRVGYDYGILWPSIPLSMIDKGNI